MFAEMFRKRYQNTCLKVDANPAGAWDITSHTVGDGLERTYTLSVSI